MRAKGAAVVVNPAAVVSSDHKRDAYGFAVRPQHVQRYKQYANIYKEEEEERSDRWKDFLERQSESAQLPVNNNAINLNEENKDEQIWTEIRLSLRAIEDMMSCRVKNKVGLIKRDEPGEKVVSEEDSDQEEFYDLERSESDPVQEIITSEETSILGGVARSELIKEELECLVRGGVPMTLRGEDLPRTFPGHPALDEDGRNALRRLLTAYARHNPSVGYCQAMNFFAGLLLLLMPEENAFWTLMGILDDYFDGYYSEDMIESQVDQLVLEELVREKFPKLGPALVTTKDAGDAVTLFQSLAGSTFDSSQLVLTACMGYQNVHEERLQELRNKHRPAVRAALEERYSQGPGSKLYNLKQGSGSADVDELYTSLNGEMELDPAKDLQEQVVWLKVEMCKLIEGKRSAELRAEELETALMEMVKQDNRRELSARVEQLEKELSQLRQVLLDKHEQENAMLQILMRVEQEQKQGNSFGAEERNDEKSSKEGQNLSLEREAANGHNVAENV
ncbi:tbc1 domain family member 8b [Phtheirospermum japonicum]|uniref:Tbc1 domain family member 8b n=1 Tax=Phtheirospermum japonicum TaxID=374723 RepID=A0A830BCI7_9LAMI|nr:tbc1 domain family member 8b [Phtheirospermum japonicum]